MDIDADLEPFFDRLHARARSAPILHRFAWFNRIMLFLAFFPTGTIKACGLRFAGPLVGEPLYTFFTTLYSTGAWWRFIGLSQMAAAVMLVIPRFRTLGAVVYLPILLNIVMITFSMDFNGTEVITTAMLLADVYLICWDYHRWKGLMPWWSGRGGDAVPDLRPTLVEKILMAATLVSGAVTLDRIHHVYHWVSDRTVQASETVFIVSTLAMVCAFVFYSARARRTALP